MKGFDMIVVFTCVIIGTILLATQEKRVNKLENQVQDIIEYQNLNEVMLD